MARITPSGERLFYFAEMAPAYVIENQVEADYLGKLKAGAEIVPINQSA